MITVQAPGKMILLGEYAVLEDAPALVAAVDRFSRVTVKENCSGKHTISAPNLEIQHIEFTCEDGQVTILNSDVHTRKTLRYCLGVLRYFYKISREEHKRLPPMEIIIDTSAFYDESGAKFGFGSSASLTVALLAGLFQYTGLTEVSPSQIYSHAMRAHSMAQGKRGSGIDVAASAFGGALEFQMPALESDYSDPISRSLPDDLYYQPVWTGKSASTSEILQQFYLQKEREPSKYNAIITNLAVIARQGCAALTKGETHSFLDNVSEFYHHLELLGEFLKIPVISQEHQQIHAIVTDAGGRYKPSGAGNGDIGIAFGDSPGIMHRIQQMLNQSRYQLLDATITESGVRLTSAATEV